MTRRDEWKREAVLDEYALLKNQWLPLSFRGYFFVEAGPVLLLLLIFNAFGRLNLVTVAIASICVLEVINMICYFTALYSDKLATRLKFILVVLFFQLFAVLGFVTARGPVPAELIDRPILSLVRIVIATLAGIYLSAYSTYTGTLFMFPRLTPATIRRQLYGLCGKCRSETIDHGICASCAFRNRDPWGS